MISQVPFVSGNASRAYLTEDVLAKIYADRGETNILNPTYIPVYPESLAQAQKQPNGTVLGTEEC
jgi:uncharacterized protein